MKLSKEQLKQIIKEELEAVMSEEERARTGTLEIGNDNNFGPVLVFSFNEGRGEGKVIEVFSSKIGMETEDIEALAKAKGNLLGDAFPDAAEWFASLFQTPYNDAALLAGLQIALQSSYNAEPAMAHLK